MELKIEAQEPETPAPLTMAGLIGLIKADTLLSNARRANLASSIRRFCRALGCDSETAPANHGFYRARLKRFHPLSAGIKKKRWHTIKADVRFALRHAGIGKDQVVHRVPYSGGWQAFRDRYDEQKFRLGLSSFANYCNARGISPQSVSDTVIENYGIELREQSFQTSPDRHIRHVCQLWNKAAALPNGLDLRPVTLPSRRKILTAPWDGLPPAFRAQAEAWLTSMSVEADLLSDTGPIKPLRPASIKSYGFTIRQIFAALVNSGIAPEAITSLDVLVHAANAKAVLEFFLKRNAGKPSSMIAGIAHVLVLIANGRVDGETMDKLKRYRKQMAVRSRGLKPKPREALRPFVDAANIEKILALPLRIYNRLRKKPKLTQKDALQMQVALALELLLMRPIRRKNIVELRIGQNIIRSGRNTFIVIEAEDVKNEVMLDYKLPPESVALLDFYINRILPLLGVKSPTWLFPGNKADRPKSAEQFGRLFTKLIRDETGLFFYPHLSRHFGAFLWLKENPGAFETMRRVLAHKSLATTTQSYASFDDNAAIRLFDDLVLRIRDGISREVKDD